MHSTEDSPWITWKLQQMKNGAGCDGLDTGGYRILNLSYITALVGNQHPDRGASSLGTHTSEAALSRMSLITSYRWQALSMILSKAKRLLLQLLSMRFRAILQGNPALNKAHLNK